MERNHIDLWRLIFTVLVCSLHSGALLTEGWERVFFPGGYIAVEFFFIVSGYYLAFSVSKNKDNVSITTIGTETVNYTITRAKRLFPEFFCGFLLTIVLTQIIYKEPLVELFRKLLSTGIYELLMLHVINPYEEMILSVAWYVSALLLATFIIYPFLRMIPNIYKNIVAPLLMICFIVFTGSRNNILLGNFTVYGCVFGGTIRAIVEISWGTFLFERVYALKNKNSNIMDKRRWLYTFIEICMFLFVISGSFFYEKTKWDFIFLLALTVGITICLADIGIKVSFISDRFLKFCGSFSYALYMSHRRVVDLTKMLFPQEDYVVRFGVYMLLAVFFALIVYKVCLIWRMHYIKNKQNV